MEGITVNKFKCYKKFIHQYCDSKGFRIMEKTRFNVMACGPQAIGKSTFLASLLQGYESNEVEPKIDSKLMIDEEDNLQIIQRGSVELNNEDNGKLQVFMYESQGYADFINNDNAIDTICDFLVRSHAKWRDLDVQVSKQLTCLPVE